MGRTKKGLRGKGNISMDGFSHFCSIVFNDDFCYSFYKVLAG